LFLKAKRQGADHGAPVAIRLQDESDYRWPGTLDFTDNELDPRSGTMRARAVLRNPGLFLTPGMFGNMRMASGGKIDALLVPDTAVQTDQARKILLVVAKDGTVAARPVTLGPVVDGLRVIRSGISAGDRVVIDGTQMAIPGGKVRPRSGTIVPGHEEAGAALNSMPPAEATLAR
jgi:RND family efflux transporter MFP subunit